MKILVTGGLGYIGSHTVVELLNMNYEVIVVDNLSNSDLSVKDRIVQITGKNFEFVLGDIANDIVICDIFEKNKIDAVIHFAGLKAVGESNEVPLKYYANNVSATITLLSVMAKYNVKNIVFSSSATVYGYQEKQPISEDAVLNEPTNPYGRTKYIIECILKDLYKSDNDWNIIILRYFNPIGAHESGLIGENPNGIPNNLLPYVSRVATGEYPYVRVWGNDYNTKDGTGVRDYIHVSDLARGHIYALKKVFKHEGIDIYNLGTGVGYSVLEIIEAFSKASKVAIPYQIMGRREGDLACVYSNPDKIFKELGFKTEKNLDQMCIDAWKWQKYSAFLKDK